MPLCLLFYIPVITTCQVTFSFFFLKLEQVFLLPQRKKKKSPESLNLRTSGQKWKGTELVANLKLLCGPHSCRRVNYNVQLGCKTRSHFHGSLCGTSEQFASSAEKFPGVELCRVRICDCIKAQYAAGNIRCRLVRLSCKLQEIDWSFSAGLSLERTTLINVFMTL